jgi:hypothetical protein
MNARSATVSRLGDGLLRAAIVGLALATAWIHYSLGGLLFLMNAGGYVALALAMVLPGPLGRARWLVRLALLAFTATTIGAWFLFGARFPLAYLDKAIEVGLVFLLAVDIWRADGGPLGIARKARDCVVDLGGALTARG